MTSFSSTAAYFSYLVSPPVSEGERKHTQQSQQSHTRLQHAVTAPVRTSDTGREAEKWEIEISLNCLIMTAAGIVNNCGCPTVITIKCHGPVS